MWPWPWHNQVYVERTYVVTGPTYPRESDDWCTAPRQPVAEKPLDVAPLKKVPQPAPPLIKEEPPKKYAAQSTVQAAQTYNVTGKEETTAYTLRLEVALEANGEKMEFKGDAAGVFTVSASFLQRARLRTKDVKALQERGTLFFFEFSPTRFEVRFYDPNNRNAPLGVLYADAVAPAGNPGCGAGQWSSVF